ncbi:MAG: GtrA family protein [Parvularculaceae bacterium]|nr:GtrA family protein [Parvularculaceae bacterium]
MKNRSRRVIEKLTRHPLTRFGSVGAIATAIDFGIFAALFHVAGLPVTAANFVSYATSLLANFYLNRRWTFRQKPGAKVAALQGGRFLVVNAVGLLLSTAIVIRLSDILPALWAKILSVPVVFVWNYMCAKYWVFRSPVTPSDPS